MGQIVATPEDVSDVMTQLSSKSDELDRVAGYLGEEARELGRAAGQYQMMNVPQVILDKIRDTLSTLDSIVSGAHSVWGEAKSVRQNLGEFD